MTINHGDTIAIKGSPLNIKGFTSYVKNYFNLMCLHWQPETARPSDALNFIVGDRSKIGKPILTGEPVNLVSAEGNGPVLYGDNIGYGQKWSQAAVGQSYIVFSCDGVPDGTAVTESPQPYWINFYTKSGSHAWGLTPNTGMTNLVQSFNCHMTVFMLDLVKKAVADTNLNSQSTTTGGANPTGMPLPKRVYYTIDDCCSEYTDSIVDYINSKSLPVIWFVNGGASSMTPKAKLSLQKICASPNCIVAIHTWDHRNMATQLQLWEVKQQIADTIKLVEEAHAAVGKKWEGPKLFRFPFTDAGQGTKYYELQQVLKDFGFQRHEDMQKYLFGKGIDNSGLFLQDGNYKTSNSADFMKHVDDSFRMFDKDFSIFFKDTLVFGTHDTKHSVEMLKFLVDNEVPFVDPRKTF